MTLTGSDLDGHGLKYENPGWKAGVFAWGEGAEKFANTHSAHPERGRVAVIWWIADSRLSASKTILLYVREPAAR